MLQMNVDDEKREILEAQRRYREQYASQYTAGYTDAEEKYMSIIKEKDESLAAKDAILIKLLAQLKDNGINPDLQEKPENN